MRPDDIVAAAERRICDVIDDCSASHWLRGAARAALGRDPVDAANDAKVLHELVDVWSAAILVAENATAAEPAPPFPVDDRLSA